MPIERFTDPDQKIRYHSEYIKRFMETDKTTPISIEVDICNICGDNCSHCHFAFTHKRGLRKPDGSYDPEKIMTLDIAETVFKKLKEGGVKSVVFSGGGEPLDSPLALEIFKIAIKYNLECGIYTRGLGLKGEIADFVAQNFEWVVVSLDATNTEDHQNIKGTGESIFNTKLKNISEFARRERHANISVSCMVNSTNLELVNPYPQHEQLLGTNKIPRILRDIHWFKDLGVDEVQIRPIVDTGSYREQEAANNIISIEQLGLSIPTQTNRENWEDHYSWIPTMIDILKQFIYDPIINPSLDKFQYVWDAFSGYEKCYAMSIAAGVVRTNGNVNKCVNMRHMPPIANLTDPTTTINSIYLSPNLDDRVDSHCRAGCRGCKLNHQMDSILTEKSEEPDISKERPRHSNFL